MREAATDCMHGTRERATPALLVVSLLFICKLEPFTPLGAPLTSWFVSDNFRHSKLLLTTEN